MPSRFIRSFSSSMIACSSSARHDMEKLSTKTATTTGIRIHTQATMSTTKKMADVGSTSSEPYFGSLTDSAVTDHRSSVQISNTVYSETLKLPNLLGLRSWNRSWPTIANTKTQSIMMMKACPTIGIALSSALMIVRNARILLKSRRIRKIRIVLSTRIQVGPSGTHKLTMETMTTMKSKTDHPERMNREYQLPKRLMASSTAKSCR
mmetsp:Transcript_75985/g.203830  ORF Transcript_75985/g.203830 Transcript_75985/m.203830 type:complete len:207 (+) Transcript_75985:1090-1710(+)